MKTQGCKVETHKDRMIEHRQNKGMLEKYF